MKLQDVPLVVLVASGKGGVGKTTVASDLAHTLRNNGNNVGLIDADISTPNTPEVVAEGDTDISEQRLATHDAIVPPTVDDIQVLSKGIALPDDVPILRDGQWRSEVVADFIEHAEWADDTDAVVIDSPPGTGEELQVVTSVAQPDAGVIVTTPHDSSLRDAKKTHEFFKQFEIEHTAVLNMAYIPNDDLVDHLTADLDIGDIEDVGGDTVETVAQALRSQAADLNIFGYNPHADIEFPVAMTATIPYSTDFDRRAESLTDTIEYIKTTQEVIA